MAIAQDDEKASLITVQTGLETGLETVGKRIRNYRNCKLIRNKNRYSFFENIYLTVSKQKPSPADSF